MTGNTSTCLNSVLPMDARTARIAAGGGLAAFSQECPAGTGEASPVRGAAGPEPDGLDLIMPHAAESRAASSLSVPSPSVRKTSFPSDDPT